MIFDVVSKFYCLGRKQIQLLCWFFIVFARRYTLATTMHYSWVYFTFLCSVYFLTVDAYWRYLMM